jgi:DNA-binding transcriptional ArsR family regulator
VSTGVEDARAELLKAMAHPVRLRILEELVADEECVCHLSALLRRSQPYVSQQLAALKEAGLVTDRRDCQRVFYRVTDGRIGDLLSSLSALAGQTSTRGTLRPTVPGCPCPKCDSSAG